MQKIFDFFNTPALEREKALNQKITSLTEKVNELESQIIALNEQIEHLDKGYAAITYIVESHNAILVELTGLSKVTSSNRSSGLSTGLPEIFSTNKSKKPN